MHQVPQSASYIARRKQAAVRAEAKARIARVSPILIVFYCVFLLPPEVEFTVFGLALSAFRIALLAVLVPVLWRLLKSGVGEVQFMDLALVIIGFWMMLSFMTIYGIGPGLTRGGGILIDVVLSYFVARSSIRSLDDLRYFLILCLPAIVIAGSFLVIESLSRTLIVRPAFSALFGNVTAYAGGDAAGSLVLKAEFRLGGLLRAYGAFPHPILAGIMMIGLLPLYYFSGLRSWVAVLGVTMPLTGFFGLSSAAFLALIVCFGAIAVYHLKAYFPRVTWWTISSLLVIGIWAVHMSTKNGIIPVISRLTLTPGTADYRQLIWKYGWISLGEYPWFGLGYRPWARLSWMGESVDAHFLLLGMRHGILVPVVLLLAMFYGMIRLGLVTKYLTPKDRALAIGINISVACFLIVGQTVNYFASANVVFMLAIAILASAVSFGDEAAKTAKRQRLIENARLVALAAARPRNAEAITSGR